eukprot:123444_1
MIHCCGLLPFIICIIWLINTITSHSTRPNFIIFYFDDLKYTQSWSASTPAGDNLNGNPLTYFNIQTPNINSIMNEGIVFPRSYAGAPSCSPSRYSLLTGRYPSRSAYAQSKTLSTSSGYDGTRVSIENVKLSQYGDDSINNLQHVLQTNDYSTGMVGKWHLMTPDDNGHNYECYRVDQGADEILYDVCKDILKTQGFDFVDGYYHENIHPNNPDYSHNPEWMVSVSQEFIDVSIEEEKPFFLYFSTTLAHVPNIYIEDVFSNYNSRQTPGGLLYADDIPNDTGMATRDEIWQMTLDTLGISNTNTATIDSSLINMIAATIWIDNAIGAMINYLKKHKLYDNTFIVLANDHGYDAKGTLYEHGSRIFQYIRYPPLFGTAGYIMPDDFIVANYDLAAVIFSLSESHIPSNYILDGTNWLPDVLNEINGVSNSKMQCCNERYIDTYNSHGIVTKNNKYIFRATDEIRTESPPPLNAYPYIHDTEQLYRLNIDPTEQKNKINSGALSDITFQFRAKMINYIEQVACIGDDITLCTKPMIINKDIPGYTCNKEVTYKQTWSGVINNNYNKIAKLNEAEINILSSTQKCNGLNNNFNSQEYVYMFDKIQSEMLRLTVILCCNNGKSFGSKYDIWPGGYTGNDVYNNNNENKYQNDDRIQNVITSIQSSNELYNNKTLV